MVGNKADDVDRRKFSFEDSQYLAERMEVCYI